MATSTIEFTATVELLDATWTGIQASRGLVGNNAEVYYGGEWLPLSDALAEWLLQVLPQEVATISTTIRLTPSPIDDASGGGVGSGGQVVTPGRTIDSAAHKTPRKVTRLGSAKPTSASK